MMSYLAIACGGAIGAVLRYALGQAMNTSYLSYGTIAANLLGCLLIGLCAGLAAKNSFSSTVSLFLITGILGGFTTFSSFSLESLQLIQTNRYFLFVMYNAIQVIGGLALAALGFAIAKQTLTY